MKKVILSIITISILSTGCVCNNTSTYSDVNIAVKNGQKFLIDKIEEDCISNKSSTQEMNECTFKAMDAWNKEIEKYLALLKNITSKDDFENIQIFQKNWEKFRDSEILVHNSIYPEGTMFQNVSTGFQRELIKQRAIELKSLYETLMNK